MGSEMCIRDSDYGAADGGTAVGLWNQVLDLLHANQPSAHLTLIGNDLPSNDNIALANNLALQINRDPKPTVLVSARSFYEPSVAPNSVSFGFSATAMHWLSASPAPSTATPMCWPPMMPMHFSASPPRR